MINAAKAHGSPGESCGGFFYGPIHLTDRGFELQLVLPDILSKALKRGAKKMAKGITTDAGPDDPIFTGRYVVSSHNKKPEPVTRDNKNHKPPKNGTPLESLSDPMIKPANSTP